MEGVAGQGLANSLTIGNVSVTIRVVQNGFFLSSNQGTFVAKDLDEVLEIAKTQLSLS